MKNQSLFDNLKERGFVYQGSDLAAIKELIDNKKITFYLGIDPTADSLHIGHLYALMMFRHLQQAGHSGILLFGGATGMIGDPSGKSDLRQMMTSQTVADNVDSLVQSAIRFIDIDKTKLVNNADWFRTLNFIPFMRDTGIHFNVSRMLSSDIYNNRLQEGGLTFLEMGYMLMQSYDFVHLHNEYNCVLQIGGSDQWGNILAGTRLYRKLKFGDEDGTQNDIFGLTSPLLLTKTGKKMGKTEKGTLWLSAQKTTPYEFYQYFYNVDDADVDTLLKAFTDIDLETIKDLIATDIIQAKKTMAYEVTKLVHGIQHADDAVQTSLNLFSLNQADQNAPTVQLDMSQLKNGINITQLCLLSKLVSSTSQARQFVQDGAILLNNQKVVDIKYTVTTTDIVDNCIILKRGKKSFAKIVFV